MAGFVRLAVLHHSMLTISVTLIGFCNGRRGACKRNGSDEQCELFHVLILV
jgi:hypothetical protein